METRFCLFCARANPGDANFCNECGTPLHLKPCRHCDAVNARSADRCYRCEAALPTETVEAAGEQREREGWVTAAAMAPGPPDAAAPEAATDMASASEEVAPRDVVARAFGAAPVTRAEPPAARAANAEADQQGPAVVPEPAPALHANDEHFAGEAQTTVDDAVRWSVDASRLPVHERASEPPQYRPQRPRKAIMVVMLLVAVGVPAGIYVAQHPEVIERLAAPLQAERDERPASAPKGPGESGAAPAGVPASAPPVEPPSSAVAAPAGTRESPEPVPPPVATREAPAESAPPPASAAPVAPTPSASRAASAPSRDAAQRSARARSQPRPPPPPRASERSGAACTPQVAALGLCTP